MSAGSISLSSATLRIRHLTMTLYSSGRARFTSAIATSSPRRAGRWTFWSATVV
jgi:hypothetical protein